jgi:hypothetical protein
MVRRVANVDMNFLEQWRVRVGQFGEGGQWWWCRFNASILAREGQ